MKVIEQNKSIITGVTRSVKQTISEDHIAKAAYLVRDQLYSDKLKATFCETLLNAVDEHRKYNVEKPVEVVITSKMLIIRDFAKGLSPDKVEQVFFQFFESTKSDNNDSIGGFGIGAKAPGSYADIYYVDSYYGGKKYSYVSTVNGYEASASLLIETDCNLNNTGICVRVPIKPGTFDATYFKDLAYDMVEQIGYFTNKQEVTLYCEFNNSIVESVFTYEDWLQKKLEHNITDGRQYIKIKDDAESTCFDNIAVIRPNSRFRSKFFRRSSYFAYDGDMAYPLQLTNEQLKKFNVTHSPYQTVLFFFKRGTLAILPSREGIVASAAFDAWLDNKAIQLNEFFKEFAPKKVQEALDSKDYLSIVRYKYRSKFGPFGYYADKYWPNFNSSIESEADIRLNTGRAVRWVSERISSISGIEKYYLVNDIDSTVSKTRLMAALREYFEINSINGISESQQISIISSTKQKEFEEIVEQSKVFRRGPDYTYISDIIKYLPAPTKRAASSISERPLAYNSKYPVSNIKETLVFTKEEKENNSAIRGIVEEKHERSNALFYYLSRFGITECAQVSKRAKAQYIKAGAKTFDDIDIMVLVKDALKNTKFLFCPDWVRSTVCSKFFQDILKVTGGYEIGSEYRNYSWDASVLSSRAFWRAVVLFPEVKKYVTELIEKAEKLFVEQMEALPDSDKERMITHIATNHCYIDDHLSSFKKKMDERYNDKQKEHNYIQTIFTNIFSNIIKTVIK